MDNAKTKQNRNSTTTSLFSCKTVKCEVTKSCPQKNRIENENTETPIAKKLILVNHHSNCCFIMKKKVDGRIKTLVENIVKRRHRGLFVVIGDKAHEQVVNLHYLLSKCLETTRPSILWCYKSNLHLSSHKAKRQKQIQKLTNRGLLDSSKDDPFTVFVACTKIRYCYYHETQKILGNTFGMCVLQVRCVKMCFEGFVLRILKH